MLALGHVIICYENWNCNTNLHNVSRIDYYFRFCSVPISIIESSRYLSAIIFGPKVKSIALLRVWTSYESSFLVNVSFSKARKVY